MKIKLNENKYYDNTKAQLENIFSGLDKSYVGYIPKLADHVEPIPGLGCAYCGGTDDCYISIQGDYVGDRHNTESIALIVVDLDGDYTDKEYIMPFDAPKLVKDANRLVNAISPDSSIDEVESILI